MADPDDPGQAVRVDDVSNSPVAAHTTLDRPGEGTGPAGTPRKALVDALGYADHTFQVATPGAPTLVMVREQGYDECGVRAWEVDALDPASDHIKPLEVVLSHVAWLRRFRGPRAVAARTVDDIEPEIVALHKG